MTLRHLRIYIAVCEEMNITKAAKKLFIAQPSISLAIRELEEYYNIKLFDRLSNRLFITSSGKKLLGYAIHIISLFERTKENVSQAGELFIGASITIGTHFMPIYIKNFKVAYPDVEVYLSINSSDIIEKKILDGSLDFALIEGVTHSSEILSSNFCGDRLAIIANPDNPLAKKENLNFENIKSQPFLLREYGSGTRESFNKAISSLGYSVNPIWESTGTTALINGVISGAGISVLPYILVKSYLDEKKVVELVINELVLRRKYNIIYHKNKYLSPIIKAFIEDFIKGKEENE